MFKIWKRFKKYTIRKDERELFFYLNWKRFNYLIISYDSLLKKKGAIFWNINWLNRTS